MLTVTLIGNGSRILCGNPLGGGTDYSPALAVPDFQSSYQIGCPPKTFGANFVGDHSCLHDNIKGNAVAYSVGVLRKVPTNRYYAYLEQGAASRIWFKTDDLYYGSKLLGTHVIAGGDAFHYVSPQRWTHDGVPWRRDQTFVDVIWTSLSSAEYRSLTTSFNASLGRIDSYVYQVFQYEFVFGDPTVKRRRKIYPTSSISFEDCKKTSVAWGSWTNWSASNVVTVTSGTMARPAVLTGEYLFSRFRSQALRVELYPQDRFTWGDLAQTAANNTQYVDINTSMYFADFFRMKQTFGSLIDLFRGRFNLKGLSAAYLSLHYGIKLTVKDTEELASGIQRVLRRLDELPFAVARSRTSGRLQMASSFPRHIVSLEWQYNFKMYYDQFDNGLIRALKSLYSWDVFPSFSNLWDLIPFSFVVDWFIGVQDQLERIDHGTYMSMLRVLGCILTSRTSVTLPLSALILTASDGIDVSGSCEMIFYDRCLTDTPPQPLSRFDVPQSFNHWIEGGALFIQRL